MLYISPLGCTGGSGQSYGSVPIIICTIPNFGGPVYHFGGLGVHPLIFLGTGRCFVGPAISNVCTRCILHTPIWDMPPEACIGYSHVFVTPPVSQRHLAIPVY